MRRLRPLRPDLRARKPTRKPTSTAAQRDYSDPYPPLGSVCRTSRASSVCWAPSSSFRVKGRCRRARGARCRSGAAGGWLSVICAAGAWPGEVGRRCRQRENFGENATFSPMHARVARLSARLLLTKFPSRQPHTHRMPSSRHASAAVHPPYADMIVEAILALKDHRGSSNAAIFKVCTSAPHILFAVVAH